jgi:hypothetical protein
MSVQELLDYQKGLLEWLMNPKAWILQANPVWGRYETMNRIALFDTKDMARAYLEASLLPELGPDESREKYKTSDGYCRSFRPDSLLWDYNSENATIGPAVPWRE